MTKDKVSYIEINPNNSRAYPIRKYPHAFRITDWDGQILKFGLFNEIKPIKKLFKELNEKGSELHTAIRGNNNLDWKIYPDKL